MNDQEAEEALKELSNYYGEPVLPVSRYCTALRTWRDCIEKTKGEDLNEDKRFQHLIPHLESLELAITKSSLLNRLIYCGEKLRNIRCPEHNGKWSGLPFSSENDCPHGCDLTGWIPDDYVDPKSGGPCSHKWRSVSIKGSVCMSCGEDVSVKVLG